MTFYKSLSSARSFGEIDQSIFKPCPAEACLVMADVENSTAAIVAGFYKEINFASAACIQAIVAKAKSFALPFVFGGDGATIILPNGDHRAAEEDLAAIQKYFSDNYDLKMRVAFIPVRSLYDRGLELYIGKAMLSRPTEQALFLGNALNWSEDILKGKRPALEGVIRLEPRAENFAFPAFEGLSCRWKPIKSKKGKILSLIVQSLSEKVSEQAEAYKDILLRVENITELPLQSRPVHLEGLSFAWFPKGMNIDLQKLPRFLPRFVKVALYLPVIWTLKLLFAIRVSLPGFSTRKYLAETEESADFFKIEGSLKLTLDCSESEIAGITKMLDELEAKKQIVYGTQLSASTLMTCLVFQPSAGNHVHFVDGSDGGYSRAAANLKKKRA